MAENITSRPGISMAPRPGGAAEELSAGEAAWEYFCQYARERPEVVVLWAFGLGFVLGWRLKPW